MKELVILSGKGGTGKTSVTAAFASIAKNMVMCDADVDAADLHLLLNPDIQQRTDFKGGGIAVIDPDKCSQCGLCFELCKFGAVEETDGNFKIDEIECEGCGVCVDLCHENAIDFPIKTCGEWYISKTRFGAMVHAKLGIAEENSGKLVALVRQEAKKIAEADKLDLIITDGPPGIGCPVIASIGQATLILIVAEPTVSGLHDMERVADLAAFFKVPAMVCINKYDLNYDQTDAIEKIALDKNIEVVGNIPFDPDFTNSMIQGKTIFEYNNDCQASRVIKGIWDKIMDNPAMNK